MASCSNDGCDITMDDYFYGKNYGHSGFQDSTASWLPNPFPEKMIFKSSRDYIATFNLSKVDTSAPRFIVRTTTKERKCGRDITEDYITKDDLFVEYQPDKSLFPIWYRKEKVVTYNFSDTLISSLDSLPDKLMLAVANSGFIFGKDSPATFYETIILDGITFTDVYHFTTTYKHHPQFVSDLYYSLTRGVIAFRFNDNEEWVRQD